jgi:hypothetical protein
MSRDSRWLPLLARASLPAWVATLAASVATAQAPEPSARAAAEPAAATAPAEQPRRKRDRRRQAEATATPAAALAPTRGAGTVDGTEAEIICKDVKPIGSRIPRRICGTEAQWGGSSEETAAHAQEQMRQIRDRSTLTGPAPSGPSSVSAPTRF